MAGLKKKTPTKSGSPNIVLVIFLVFFFLVSIGLGIWGYYGYAGQADLLRAKKSESDAKNAEKTGRRFYTMQWDELRLALGEKLNEKETQRLETERAEFEKEGGGIFSGEADKDAARTLLDNHRKILGLADNGKDFARDYPKELKVAQDEAKDWKAKAEQAIKKQQRLEELTDRLTKQQDAFHAAANKRIADDNAKQIAIVSSNLDNFKKATENTKKAEADLAEKANELNDFKGEHEKIVKSLQRQIAVLNQDLKELRAAGTGPGGAPGGGGTSGQYFPLVLDISPGKPLWDHPLGKVTKVELDLRQVTINLGSSHGVKPELTFNIFGANSSGRAEGWLKGSIEVIKVEGPSTSLCRITSLYDAEGHEILLNLQTRNRFQREAQAPIREGDLLFNLFWGTRVAVAGYVSITGDATDNPADQVRQMDDFMHLLKRNGIQVDAYVDLRDGKVVGRMTPKTRYLIRGDDFRASGAEKPKVDEEKKDEKEPAKDGAVNSDRNDTINKSNLMLRNDAKERGLMVISAENFATVIGYRKARSANSAEASGFRPAFPYAAAPQAGVLVLPADRPREDMEKKN